MPDLLLRPVKMVRHFYLWCFVTVRQGAPYGGCFQQRALSETRYK